MKQNMQKILVMMNSPPSVAPEVIARQKVLLDKLLAKKSNKWVEWGKNYKNIKKQGLSND